MSKSFRNRMGTVMRRTSSVLTLSRPASRASSEADANSIHKIDTSGSPPNTPPPSQRGRSSTSSTDHAPFVPGVTDHLAPSPIAESPAREAAATQEEATESKPLGPSPLAQQVVTAEPALAAEQTTTTTNSEGGYVPPPILTSTANPGAFTDEPEEMGQLHDEERPSVEATQEQAPVPQLAERVQPTAQVDAAPAPQVEVVPETAPRNEEVPAETIPIVMPGPVLHAAPVVEPEPAPQTTHDEAIFVPAVMPIAEPAIAVVDEPQQPSSSYVNVPVSDTVVPIPLDPSPDSARERHNIHSPTYNDTVGLNDNPWGGPNASMGMPRPFGMPHDETADVYVPMHIPPQPAPSYAQDRQSNKGTESVGRVTAKSSRASLAALNTGFEEKHVKIASVPVVSDSGRTNGDAMGRSRSGSVTMGGGEKRSRAGSVSAKMPLEDPFADPPNMPEPSPAPAITVSYSEGPQMPYPEIHADTPKETPEDVYGPAIMPLPPIHDVIPSKSVQSLAPSSQGHYEPDTDETRPLLSSRPHTPRGQQHLSSYLNTHVAVSPQVSTTPNPNSTAGAVPHLHNLGWIEYILPDASFYYVHPTLRVTTDIDLRNMKRLDAVTKYLDRKDGSSGYGTSAGTGWEMWLRDASDITKRKGKKDELVPVQGWVDHRTRIVTFNEPGGRGPVEEEDRLDMEYRYWSFIEAHPAHVSLPPNAKAEAIDVLTWAYTDRLLPHPQGSPPPFSQEECSELTTLLRSFGDNPNEQGLQPVVYTRIIARILLRVAEVRQAYFRPNKPLPKDASKRGLYKPTRSLPFRRVLLDFVISCLCLGIPYLFFDRTQHQPRVDEESGIRTAGPMLMVGACTCLVAAIVLSASVTFLSLPGLDNVTRIMALVAILCSAACMASSVVALFRYKADMERTVSATIGGEGLMMLSSRNVIMSLPLVFLAYAIMGFVAGIVLYSFRGVTATDSSLIIHHFDDYTRWTVVGLVSGLAGMLVTSVWMMRR